MGSDGASEARAAVVKSDYFNGDGALHRTLALHRPVGKYYVPI